MSKFDKEKYEQMKRKNSFDIEYYGSFMVSRSVVEQELTTPNFWIREEPIDNEFDNGWRIMGGADSEEFLSDPTNWLIINIYSAFQYCPAVLTFFDAPIGTELYLDIDFDGVVHKVHDLVNDCNVDITELPNYLRNLRLNYT